jgi:hypothetical protein
MSLAPLLDAAPAIPVHAFAAMAAFVLGVVQFAAPKGTLPHRAPGWIWVGPDAGGGGRFVLAAGADHAHRRIRSLAVLATAVPIRISDVENRTCRAGSNCRFCGRADEACASRKSLEKRREKPVALIS